MKYHSEEEKSKVWLYALQALGGVFVLWLLGYVVYTFAVI